MHRIDGAGATVDSKFTEGNPATGVPATTVTADILNALQEESCYVIEQAGLTLNKADNTQLRQAILKMVSDAAKSVRIDNVAFGAGVVNGEVVRWDSGTSTFVEAIADGTANNQAVGIADVTNLRVYAYGETPAIMTGLTPGAKYYLSGATAGAVTTVAAADQVLVGIAKSATTLFVDIDVAPASFRINQLKLADGVTSAFDGSNVMQPGVSVPMARLAFKGALTKKTTTQSTTSAVTALITFDGETYDTDAFHDLVTNTDRLTVPAGVNIVRIHARIVWASNPTGYREVRLNKNGAEDFGGQCRVATPAASGIETKVQFTSPPLYVVAGDYFNLYATQNSGGALDVLGAANGNLQSWFGIEVLG